jgi:hypothetical protein
MHHRPPLAELERKVGQQQLELHFFGKPCGKSRPTPADRRAWREAIYAVIEVMTGMPQGRLTVARLSAKSHLGGAGYHRQFRA